MKNSERTLWSIVFIIVGLLLPAVGKEFGMIGYMLLAIPGFASAIAIYMGRQDVAPMTIEEKNPDPDGSKAIQALAYIWGFTVPVVIIMGIFSYILS